MLIVNNDGEILGRIVTNHSMTLDEALDFIRDDYEYIDGNEDVKISGKWYYSENLGISFEDDELLEKSDSISKNGGQKKWQSTSTV